MADLLIKNARIYYHGELVERSLAVEGGKIKRFAAEKAERVLDAKGLVVLPGLIDMHVHFRDPGYTKKEDFFTGSQAALHGGVTTVFDQPNTKPAPCSQKTLLEKQLAVSKKASVDYNLNAGVGKDSLDEIIKLGKKTLAFGEIFMTESVGGMVLENLSDFEEALRRIRETGRVAVVHAEDAELNKEGFEKHRDKKEPWHHAAARPRESENKATMECLSLAKKTLAKTHVTHMTTRESLDMVISSEADVSCDVTPHHLFLQEDDMKKLGNMAKMNPPLRTKKDRLALWAALQEGKIDMIGTDHAPHLLEEKEKDWQEAPSGVPGIETMLPLLFDQVNKKTLSIQRLVELVCSSPARRFGVSTRKGNIYPGFDADLVLINPKLEKKVNSDDLYTKCGWSPFEGRRLKGWPVYTVLRGKVLMEDGEVYAEKGWGKSLV